MIYRISEFADKCGVNKETIRYYERKNLLQEPHRTEAGYRIYSYDDVKRVGFIKRIQELGFSLRGPERLVGICIDKGYKFPLNQCFKAYLFFIFNSLKCLGIDNKSNLYSPRKVICSQLIGDTCFIYLVTSGSILTR